MATNPNSMVQEAVDAAISKRGEIGLQVVAYVDGKQVVDVWGGLADITTGRQVDAEIEVAQVNRLIRDCADDQHVFYAEIGDVLVTSGGLLSAEISPDQLHFTARGYALLAARLEPELDRLLNAED